MCSVKCSITNTLVYTLGYISISICSAAINEYTVRRIKKKPIAMNSIQKLKALGELWYLFWVLILFRINYLTDTTSNVCFRKVYWESLNVIEACLHLFLLIIFI